MTVEDGGVFSRAARFFLRCHPQHKKPSEQHDFNIQRCANLFAHPIAPEETATTSSNTEAWPSPAPPPALIMVLVMLVRVVVIVTVIIPVVRMIMVLCCYARRSANEHEDGGEGFHNSFHGNSSFNKLRPYNAEHQLRTDHSRVTVCFML